MSENGTDFQLTQTLPVILLAFVIVFSTKESLVSVVMY